MADGDCRHVQVRITRVPVLGGSFDQRTVNCSLKMQSEANRLTIYQALFSKGIGGSFVGDNCPVADEGRWAECPYYQAK